MQLAFIEHLPYTKSLIYLFNICGRFCWWLPLSPWLTSQVTSSQSPSMPKATVSLCHSVSSVYLLYPQKNYHGPPWDSPRVTPKQSGIDIGEQISPFPWPSAGQFWDIFYIGSQRVSQWNHGEIKWHVPKTLSYPFGEGAPPWDSLWGEAQKGLKHTDLDSTQTGGSAS